MTFDAVETIGENMAIDVQQIDSDQGELVKNIGEGHYSDVKAIDIRPARLTETISAFANADGGELYVGIDEIGVPKFRKWRGFVNVEGANGHLQIFEELFPLGRDFSYTFLSCPGEEGLVLKVEIQKTEVLPIV